MRFFVVASFASLALANIYAPGAALFKRQSGGCNQGDSLCGVDDCYNPSTEVCCSAYSVHCDKGEYCTVGDDGNPACCPTGKICSGSAGGVLTTGTATGTYTGTAAATNTNTFTTSQRITTSVGGIVGGATTSITSVRTASQAQASTTSRNTANAQSTASSSSTPNGALATSAPLFAAAGLLAAQILI